MFNFIKILKKIDNLKLIQWQVLTGPVLILIILSMVVLPLPPFVLDLFFTFNIALSIMILLAAMFTRNTLDFAAFPSILLFSTLLRLALNVASTRIILLNGHKGSNSAGYVVESFGHFLVGDNFVIGSIVFIILVIINFMVITKGAGRIAEVGARFILDGMPGKQMAIDADLNAGLIGEKEATKRRKEISQEADFYGSMDGASKFVRGDAIAGILIMIINVFFGLIIALMQHQMLLKQAIKVYTLLTIGDGLVAQIPALVISTAAGVIVTRVSTEQNVGEQMITQLFCDFRVIFLSALVLCALGLVPGMPNVTFLLFSCSLMFLSWKLYQKDSNKTFQNFLNTNKELKKNDFNFQEASWNDVQLESTISIELGNFLDPLININSDQDLKYKISLIRKNFAKKIGFLPSRVHIYINSELPGNDYKIFIRGLEIGYGSIFCNKFLLINSDDIEDEEFFSLSDSIKEPVFGFKAHWIDSAIVEKAKKKKYTVVTPVVVLVTHLNHLMLKYIHELFGREEAKNLLQHIAKDMPQLIEDFIPNIISLTVFHKVINNLLFENVSIRNMRTIIETLIEQPSSLHSLPQELTNVVRIALGKVITQKLFPTKINIINVITLNSNLETLLLQIIENSEGKMEPDLSENIINQTEIAINKQKSLNLPVVLLVQDKIRTYTSYFLRQQFPELTVLSHSELFIENRIVKSTNIVGQ